MAGIRRQEIDIAYEYYYLPNIIMTQFQFIQAYVEVLYVCVSMSFYVNGSTYVRKSDVENACSSQV